ncbi:MAG: copper resistance protein NlpE N-terminal domain-containing protein [Bacteroidota bacterium]|nr:copper resistance protein NlpE N-terminal domain-containing protein [Bacteroidota bacterium]
MKKILLPLLFFSIAACNTTADKTKQPQADSEKLDGTRMLDTPVINKPAEPEEKDTARLKLPKPVAVRPPNGIFRAVVPCSGCKGIQHTIAFYRDKTYHLEEAKWDKDSTFTKTEGFWSISNGFIWLYKEQVLVGRYQWKGDTLVYVQGNRKTPLHHVMAATDNAVLRRKKEEGLTFFGIGNEPFWRVEYSNSDTLSFFMSEWKSPLRLKAAIQNDKDSIFYTALNDSAQLKVTVLPYFRSDGMSDYIYKNKVLVTYNGKMYRGCGILYQ